MWDILQSLCLNCWKLMWRYLHVCNCGEWLDWSPLLIVKSILGNRALHTRPMQYCIILVSVKIQNKSIWEIFLKSTLCNRTELYCFVSDSRTTALQCKAVFYHVRKSWPNTVFVGKIHIFYRVTVTVSSLKGLGRSQLKSSKSSSSTWWRQSLLHVILFQEILYLAVLSWQ